MRDATGDPSAHVGESVVLRPHIAARWFAGHHRHHGIDGFDPEKLLCFVCVMRAGHWRDGSVLLVCEGRLHNGRHRTLACVGANTPIIVTVQACSHD